MIALVSHLDAICGNWRLAVYDLAMHLVVLQRQELATTPSGASETTWVTVRGVGMRGPTAMGIMIQVGGSIDGPLYVHVLNHSEALALLKAQVRSHLAEERQAMGPPPPAPDPVISGLMRLGQEHEPLPGWMERVLAETEREQARNLVIDMQRMINGHMGPMNSDTYQVAQRIIAERVLGFLSVRDRPAVDCRSLTEVAADKIAKLEAALGDMTAKRDRIAGEKADLKAEVARLRDEISRLVSGQDHAIVERDGLKAEVKRLEGFLAIDERFKRELGVKLEAEREISGNLRGELDRIEKILLATREAAGGHG